VARALSPRFSAPEIDDFMFSGTVRQPGAINGMPQAKGIAKKEVFPPLFS